MWKLLSYRRRAQERIEMNPARIEEPSRLPTPESQLASPESAESPSSVSSQTEPTPRTVIIYDMPVSKKHIDSLDIIIAQCKRKVYISSGLIFLCFTLLLACLLYLKKTEFSLELETILEMLFASILLAVLMFSVISLWSDMKNLYINMVKKKLESNTEAQGGTISPSSPEAAVSQPSTSDV